MAEERPTFTVQKRTESGKGPARRLRAEGMIPGVCYGTNTDSVSVTADPKELYKLLTTRRSTNIVFQLDIEGGDSHDHVMVRDYQIDPVRRELRHADFVVVNPDELMKLTIPVETHGKPVGEKEGGRLQMLRGEIPVWVRPSHIPVAIDHEVSEMGIGDSLLASELELPEGTEPAYKIDFAVATVILPRAKPVTTTAAAVEGEEGELLEGEEGELPEGEEGEEGEEATEEAAD